MEADSWGAALLYSKGQVGGGHGVGLGLLCVAEALRWLSEKFIGVLIIPVRQNVWNRKRLVLGKPKTHEGAWRGESKS